MSKDDFSDAWHLWVLLLLCLVMMGPSQLMPGAEAFGRPTRDLFDHLALMDAWFLDTEAWNWPDGGTLVPPDLLGMLIAQPFLGLGRGAAHNWVVFLQLFGACAAGWAVGRRFGNGLVAGVAFGFSPYLIGQAISGETETLAVWPVALVVLLVHRGSTWGRVSAGLMAALAAIASWYHGVFAVVYLLLWSGKKGWEATRTQAFAPPRTSSRRSRKETWISLGQVWGPFIALVAWPAWFYSRVLEYQDQLFRGPTMRDYLDTYPRALTAMVADPGGWLGAAPAGEGHVDLLGWGIVILAVAGFVGWNSAVAPKALAKTSTQHPGRWWWAGIAGVAMVLALGPVLVLNGVQITQWTPYRLLVDLPVLGLMRLTHRWMLLATLALAVLAARGARPLPLLAAALIAMETLWFGVPERPLTAVGEHPLADHLSGPVLDLPARTLESDARGRYLVWQREHNQPIPYALSMQGWSTTIGKEPLVVAVTSLDSQDPIPRRLLDAGQFRQAGFAKAVASWLDAKSANKETFFRGQMEVLQGASGRLQSLGLQSVVLHTALLTDDDSQAIQSLLKEVLGEPVRSTQGAVQWEL